MYSRQDLIWERTLQLLLSSCGSVLAPLEPDQPWPGHERAPLS